MIPNIAIFLYAFAGLIVAGINIYMQLFVADNWPPSRVP